VKFFRKLRQNRESQLDTARLRLRVESCVSVILELNKSLGAGKIRPEIIEQFERLKDSLKFVSGASVDEADINRIEEATNQLLAELGQNPETRPLLLPREGWTH
jgi:hypothetical protein